MLNFDLKVAEQRRMLQLIELDELRLEAYESPKIYEERTKRWHEKHIMKKQFKEGDMTLLFNSKLRLFLGELRYQWLERFWVIKIFSHGAIKVWSDSTGSFKVNG